MGTWSGEPFGNDKALDWAWELDDSSDWEVVRAALSEALDADGEIDSDVATVAIAAADVVGQALGRSLADDDEVAGDSDESPGGDELDKDEDEDDDENDEDDESVAAFLARAGYPPADIVQLASTALDTATGPRSVLTELWIESGADEWNQANARVRAALNG